MQKDLQWQEIQDAHDELERLTSPRLIPFTPKSFLYRVR